MNVSEFEEKVWDVDRIRIVVRAPENTIIGDYMWTNASSESSRVTQWLEGRITPNVDGHQVVVLQGDGEEPHGRVILRTLRQTYI